MGFSDSPVIKSAGMVGKKCRSASRRPISPLFVTVFCLVSLELQKCEPSFWSRVAIVLNENDTKDIQKKTPECIQGAAFLSPPGDWTNSLRNLWVLVVFLGTPCVYFLIYLTVFLFFCFENS